MLLQRAEALPLGDSIGVYSIWNANRTLDFEKECTTFLGVKINSKSWTLNTSTTKPLTYIQRLRTSVSSRLCMNVCETAVFGCSVLTGIWRRWSWPRMDGEWQKDCAGLTLENQQPTDSNSGKFLLRVKVHMGHKIQTSVALSARCGRFRRIYPRCCPGWASCGPLSPPATRPAGWTESWWRLWAPPARWPVCHPALRTSAEWWRCSTCEIKIVIESPLRRLEMQKQKAMDLGQKDCGLSTK